MIRYWDIKLERLILSCIIHVSGIIESLYQDKDFSREIFSDEANRFIYDMLVKCWKKTGNIPTETLIKRYIIKYLPKSKLLNKEEQINKYQLIIERLYEKKPSNSEISQISLNKEQLYTFKMGRVVQEHILDIHELLEDGNVNSAMSKALDLKSEIITNNKEVDQGLFTNDVNKRIKLAIDKRKNPEKYKPVSTGLLGWNPNRPFDKDSPKSLDLFLEGGHYKGEMTLVIGDSGGGKSYELLNLAYNAALNGKNVSLFTIEMSRLMVCTRLDSLVSGVPFSNIRSGILTKKQINRWKSKVEKFNNECGNLYVVGFPRGCNVQDIELKSKEIEQMTGCKLDVLLVDYLNDLSAVLKYDQSSKDWSAQGDISWDLKLLAQSWNQGDGISLITANQGKTSSALGKFKVNTDGLPNFRRMNWTDAAFSPLPSHHASTIIGILLSKEDENGLATIMNHQIIKQRNGVTTIGIVTFPDLSRSNVNSVKKYRKAKKIYKDRETVEDFEDEF